MYRIPQIGTFLTAERMNAFWNYVGALLKYVAPIIMIMVAFYLVSMLLELVINAFRKGAKKDEKRRNDDDDYDMKYY